MKRVLAFFGAFNPLTVAHVELARFAMEATGREGVVFVPSKARYIRAEQGKDYAYDDDRRLEMLESVAESRPWMRVSDLELRAKVQPRTYHTLCRLRDEQGLSPALLLGSDKLGELETVWRHVEAIAREFGFVCLTRGRDACDRILKEDPYLAELAPWIRVIETPAALRDVSSTAVREKLAGIRTLRREIEQMVPAEILPLL
ncbi:MAG: hypothetical protein IJH38_03370 [Clostridia bacterium]|nr:hypothetical protein [Clostridia bacterium]